MKYKANIIITDGDKTTEPDEEIEFSEEDAQPLLDIGAISEIEKKPAPKKTPAK